MDLIYMHRLINLYLFIIYFFLLQASRPITLKKENIQTRNRKVCKKMVRQSESSFVSTTPESFWPEFSSSKNNDTATMCTNYPTIPATTTLSSSFYNYLPQSQFSQSFPTPQENQHQQQTHYSHPKALPFSF